MDLSSQRQKSESQQQTSGSDDKEKQPPQNAEAQQENKEVADQQQEEKPPSNALIISLLNSAPAAMTSTPVAGGTFACSSNQLAVTLVPGKQTDKEGQQPKERESNELLRNLLNSDSSNVVPNVIPVRAPNLSQGERTTQSKDAGVTMSILATQLSLPPITSTGQPSASTSTIISSNPALVERLNSGNVSVNTGLEAGISPQQLDQNLTKALVNQISNVQSSAASKQPTPNKPNEGLQVLLHPNSPNKRKTNNAGEVVLLKTGAVVANQNGTTTQSQNIRASMPALTSQLASPPLTRAGQRAIAANAVPNDSKLVVSAALSPSSDPNSAKPGQKAPLTSPSSDQSKAGSNNGSVTRSTVISSNSALIERLTSGSVNVNNSITLESGLSVEPVTKTLIQKVTNAQPPAALISPMCSPPAQASPNSHQQKNNTKGSVGVGTDTQQTLAAILTNTGSGGLSLTDGSIQSLPIGGLDNPGNTTTTESGNASGSEEDQTTEDENGSEKPSLLLNILQRPRKDEIAAENQPINHELIAKQLSLVGSTLQIATPINSSSAITTAANVTATPIVMTTPKLKLKVQKQTPEQPTEDVAQQQEPVQQQKEASDPNQGTAVSGQQQQEQQEQPRNTRTRRSATKCKAENNFRNGSGGGSETKSKTPKVSE